MAEVDQLRFPLLSDFNKDVSAAYDVLYPDLLGFKGVSKRSAFVIDENGTIVYAESSDDPNNCRTSKRSSLHSKPKLFSLRTPNYNTDP